MKDSGAIEVDMKKLADDLAELNNKQVEIDQELEIANKQQGSFLFKCFRQYLS